MYVHNWSKVDAEVFHDFHLGWVVLLSHSLNGGLLSDRYYSMIEQHAGHEIVEVLARTMPPAIANADTTYRQLRRTIAIRHVSGHRVVALIEIVSPGNKDRVSSVEEFADKAQAALRAGIHLLVIDLFPHGTHDPHRMHGAIWEPFDPVDYQPENDKPLMLAAYEADQLPEAYLEPFAVGDSLSDMPLFIRRGRYVNVPLEQTYQTAFQSVPAVWRKVLEPTL